MDKIKHTPGPWEAECVGAGGSPESPVNVYEITNGSRRIAEHVAERDAHLIAAAPDLLAALREIIRYVDSVGSESVNRVPFVAARAAIAKAEGR